MGVPWTVEELASLQQMRSLGMTGQQIADALGRTKVSVLDKANKMGFALPRVKAADREALLREAFENGATVEHIAKALGICRKTVHDAYHDYSAQIIAKAARPVISGPYIGAKEMAAIVAPICGCTVKAIFSRSRFRANVIARMAMVRALRDRGLALSTINRAIGKSDHSTVLNLLAKFDSYARHDARLLEAYNAIKDAEARAAERLAA